MNILGICGSLRRGSYNRSLLRAAIEVAPSEFRFTLFERLHEVPLYNEDVEKEGDPESVEDFKAQIRAADALLIATPEYNYGIPGVLKNAIDWASRPPGSSPLEKKPCGIIGASQGAVGTARSQLSLRQSFVFTGTLVMLKPEILVGKAQEKFDHEGKLIDPKTRKFLGEYMRAYAEWVERFRVDSPPPRRSFAHSNHAPLNH